MNHLVTNLKACKRLDGRLFPALCFPVPKYYPKIAPLITLLTARCRQGFLPKRQQVYIRLHAVFGPGSSAGIATGYGLDGPGIESRWGARFSASVQTGPGAHPASCTMGTGSFPGVKSGRGVTLTPHPLLVPLVMKE